MGILSARLAPTSGAVMCLAAATCLMTPQDVCHERAMAELGCCPLCFDDCSVSQEEIERMCGELEEPAGDEARAAEGVTDPADSTPQSEGPPDPR